MAENPTRVLLTLDCDRLDADALKAIAALAEDRNLEITGLYVEDEDLLTAARLPGLSEVSVATGEVKKLTRAQMEAQVVGQAHRARRDFESSVGSLNIKYSFRVVRGRAVETVTEAAVMSDIVVVSRALRGSGLRSRRGRYFEPLIQRHKNLLFVNEPWASGTCVVALCESGSGGRALTVARRIADAENIELVTAIPAGVSGTQLVAGDRVVRLDAWTEDAVADLCELEDARLLILPSSEQLDWQRLLVDMVDRVPCSLLRLD